MSIRRDLLNSSSVIAIKEKWEQYAVHQYFKDTFSDKTLWVTLLSTSLLPQEKRPATEQEYIYILLSLEGKSYGKFLDAETAFATARAYGRIPRWAH